uniref:ER membrane protein complex subunit 7 beta-sandwich domain-containing protein n=2 Tax=Lygus hesperus TaxID=30085 RepID=A0A0A9WCZ8_LYGHE
MLFKYCSFLVISLIHLVTATNDSSEVLSGKDVQYTFITGKVFPPVEILGEQWQADTRVYLKGASQKGFIREDGTFVFTNVPPGSYIVEVTHPKYAFEQARVEINSKGKIRARKVNHIQTSVVIQVPYPLKIKAYSPIRFFQVREQWRITDFLFNPMVLMMVLPLLLVMVLPRMMNDPEARKEMEQLGNLTKYDMPEMSEVITSFFRGNQPKQQQRCVKPAKKSSKQAAS